MFFAGYDPVVEPSVDCCKFRISSSFSIQKPFDEPFPQIVSIAV